MKKYLKMFIILICFIVISIGSFICYKLSFKEEVIEEDNIAFVEVTSEETSTNNFYIDIKGCVNNPGVYYVSEGMIVEDAISLAGGLKSYAYTDNINLSMKLVSEMVIYINSKSDMTSTTVSVRNDALVTTNVVNTSNGKVNINTASLNELLTVSGIGEAKAKSIISYRENNKFNSIEDIMNVSGIGESLFEQIKNSITV